MTILDSSLGRLSDHDCRGQGDSKFRGRRRVHRPSGYTEFYRSNKCKPDKTETIGEYLCMLAVEKNYLSPGIRTIYGENKAGGRGKRKTEPGQSPPPPRDVIRK